jgi:hypothetical protein
VRRRVLLVVAAVIVALLVVGQLALPSLAGQRIEDRLTDEGGTADVEISSFPAVRLLFSDGQSIDVTGAGLDLQHEEDDPAVFDKLDGFDEVDVELSNSRVGPFEVSRFSLTRDGSEPYSLEGTATTTGAELADFAAEQIGLPSGPLFRFLVGQLPAGSADVPVRLDMELASDDGAIRVVSGGSTIAGIPTGPLGAFITTLVVVRI